jgi:hypothetical protein
MALTGEERAEPRGIDLHVTAPRPNALSGGLRGLVASHPSAGGAALLCGTDRLVSSINIRPSWTASDPTGDLDQKAACWLRGGNFLFVPGVIGANNAVERKHVDIPRWNCRSGDSGVAVRGGVGPRWSRRRWSRRWRSRRRRTFRRGPSRRRWSRLWRYAFRRFGFGRRVGRIQ